MSVIFDRISDAIHGIQREFEQMSASLNLLDDAIEELQVQVMELKAEVTEIREDYIPKAR